MPAEPTSEKGLKPKMPSFVGNPILSANCIHKSDLITDGEKASFWADTADQGSGNSPQYLGNLRLFLCAGLVVICTNNHGKPSHC